MHASDYQKLAIRTSNNKNITHQCPRCELKTPDTNRQISVATIGLIGEAAEVSEHVKKYLGHGRPLDLNLMVKELGDVLWYVANLSQLLGIDMAVIMQANIDKLRERWPDGFKEDSPHAAGDLFDTSKEKANA